MSIKSQALQIDQETRENRFCSNVSEVDVTRCGT